MPLAQDSGPTVTENGTAVSPPSARTTPLVLSATSVVHNSAPVSGSRTLTLAEPETLMLLDAVIGMRQSLAVYASQ
jgi:hypothetical protein